MKLLHTSDWHLGKSLYEFSLQPDQEYFITGLLDLLAKQRVDAVLLAGDIYDRPVPPIWALQLFDHFLSQATQRLGIPVLAVAGNHDSGARLEFGSSLYRSGGYHICGHLEQEAMTVTLGDSHGPVHITLLPYLHPADVRALWPEEPVRTYDDAYRLYLSRQQPDPAARNLAVAHGFFSCLGGGSRPVDLLTSDSEISVGGMDIADAACFAPFDYTALGHLHAPQWVREGSIRYSGSPFPYSLSEERQGKTFTLLTLGEKGSVHAEPLPCPLLHRVRSVSGRFEELMDPAFHRDNGFSDYVFADIQGEELPYPMEKLRALFPNLLGLRFSASAGGGAADIAAMGQRAPKLSTRELFLRFYAQVKGEEIPDSQLQLLDEALEELEDADGEDNA